MDSSILGIASMASIAQDVYQYSELSDEAKEKARDSWRDTEAEDFGSHGELFENAETAAKLLGITFDTNTVKLHGWKTREESHIMYSGFWSQGDGASFTGSYEYRYCVQTVRDEFGTDEKLWAIADGLTALNSRIRMMHDGLWLNGKITQDGRYVHKMTMDAMVYDSEGEEFSYDDPITKDFLELMRDFAQWIYDGLEKEYYWRTSDEAIEDYLNDREFDEDGVIL